MREYKTTEKKREYQRKYYAATKEARQAYNKKWRLEHPEQWRRLSREGNRRRRGIPLPAHPAPAVCECCGRPPRGNKALVPDHCHTTGKPRGWLCAICNGAIGLLGDNLVAAQRACAYLLKYHSE